MPIHNRQGHLVPEAAGQPDLRFYKAYVAAINLNFTEFNLFLATAALYHAYTNNLKSIKSRSPCKSITPDIAAFPYIDERRLDYINNNPFLVDLARRPTIAHSQ